ncbi:hypothetical protein ACJEIK_23815 [Mycobacterium sp. SMC-16]|uniref:hypothetical protein n=1 Tax=Mycobacteriaceae TaxID=1762 RepID=UPI001CF9F095|nr:MULTISPECIES: hypothetical protein [Mycolicibacterium]MCX8554786.1 hypothetical protein [Mycolicibacterium mucogenicum]UCZ59796.1 hypothetical protein LHJ73_24475 [Mycolicibacterium phocaicum]
MTEPTPSASARPQAVTAAFWCWVVAGGLLAAIGSWQLSLSIPGQFRAIGGLLAAVGLGLGFLAGRTRRGDARFRRAAIALAMATVLLIALLLLVFGADPLGFLVLTVVMALAIGGMVSITRPPAQSWFDGKADT